MSNKPRGNALVFVLLLIAVIMLIVYAGTTLQPLQAKALDQHLHTLTHQALLDCAIEEALANLQAGRSPDFSKELRLDGQSAHVAAQQSHATADTVALEITTRIPQADEESRTTQADLVRIAGAWRLKGCSAANIQK